MDTVLLRSIHGSKLYGLDHADSDSDYYTVVSREKRGARRKYAKQSIKDGIDSMTVDLSTFMYFCEEGVPQALEAMFSESADIDMIEDLRRGYRVNTAKATRTYRRTIRNFAEGDFKKRRHALRLLFNMLEFQETGRFCPRLSPREILICNSQASMEDGHWKRWTDTMLGGKYEATDLNPGNRGQRKDHLGEVLGLQP